MPERHGGHAGRVNQNLSHRWFRPTAALPGGRRSYGAVSYVLLPARRLGRSPALPNTLRKQPRLGRIRLLPIALRDRKVPGPPVSAPLWRQQRPHRSTFTQLLQTLHEADTQPLGSDLIIPCSSNSTAGPQRTCRKPLTLLRVAPREAMLTRGRPTPAQKATSRNVHSSETPRQASGRFRQKPKQG